MAIQRGVQTVSYKTTAVTGQFVPVKLTASDTVALATAQTDYIRGITMIDSTIAGDAVDVAFNAGATVLCTVGAGGWTVGQRLGLGADFISLIAYNQATHNQVIGIAETTAAAGVLAPVTLLLQVKTS